MAGKTTVRNREASLKNLYLYGGILLAGVIVTGGAILFGRSDEGVINVSEAIRSSNVTAQQSADDSGAGETIVPVENTRSSLPNGGLVGKGDVTPRPEPKVESASSTDDSATSTDEMVDSETEEGSSDETDAGASSVEEGSEETPQ
jgi:hypothetical protein